MISAKDLRIGNIISDEWGTIIEVEDINNEGINLFIDNDGNYPELAETWIEPEYTFDKLFGLPLTEQNLPKLGIKKQYQENPFEEGKYTLNEDGSRYYSWVKGCFNLEMDKDGKFMFEVYSHYIPLDYVHQLQNLFYLLTNEELTYIK